MRTGQRLVIGDNRSDGVTIAPLRYWRKETTHDEEKRANAQIKPIDSIFKPSELLSPRTDSIARCLESHLVICDLTCAHLENIGSIVCLKPPLGVWWDLVGKFLWDNVRKDQKKSSFQPRKCGCRLALGRTAGLRRVGWFSFQLLR